MSPKIRGNTEKRKEKHSLSRSTLIVSKISFFFFLIFVCVGVSLLASFSCRCLCADSRREQQSTEATKKKIRDDSKNNKLRLVCSNASKKISWPPTVLSAELIESLTSLLKNNG